MGPKYAMVQGEDPHPLDDMTKDAPYASVAAGADEFHSADESEQHSQSTKLFTAIEPRSQLPPVDIGSSTKFQCLSIIVLGVACCLACIIYSIHSLSTENRHRYRRYPLDPLVALPSGLPGEASSFIANLILTQCLEGLAYVHSISLRWALLKENRLVFNTNIRLFTSSRLSRPNSWYVNAISAALLIVCYGATSILVVPDLFPENGQSDTRIYLNLIALLILGLALLGQTLLAIWCYWDNLRDIPSWSSNPLNTTVTMLNQGMVQHREGRCMRSLQHLAMKDETPTFPRTRQPNQWASSTSAKRANIFTWVLVGLSFIWWIVIVLVARGNMRGAIKTIEDMNGHPLNSTWHFSWSWDTVSNAAVDQLYVYTYQNAVCFSLDPTKQGAQAISLSLSTDLFVSFLFVCAIQGLQTMGLHCAELSINLSRDEDVWRSLAASRRFSTKKNVLSTPPFWAALFSWKSNMLTIFKSLLHWLLGQSLQPALILDSYDGNSVWFTMIFARLFVYVVSTIVFATFITYLTVGRPRGPQPATYGHLKTIADLVDDWTLDKEGRFWWGDKGVKDGVRHAGMSCKEEEPKPIHMDAVYAG